MSESREPEATYDGYRVVPADSPFRRLPRSLPRKQILHLDALRLSAEMAEVSFGRLERLLAEKTQGTSRDGFAANALACAYSTIDSIHRYRQVLEATPRIKHNAPYELWMRRSKSVTYVRNVLQHLRNEIAAIEKAQRGALGTLTWLGPASVEGGPRTSWMLEAGASYPGQVTIGPTVDTWERASTSDSIVDISLTAVTTPLNISKLMHSLRSIMQSLDLALGRGWPETDARLGSDRVVRFEMRPRGEEPQEPA